MTVPTFKPEIPTTTTTTTTTETSTTSSASTEESFKSTSKEIGTFTDATIAIANNDNFNTETSLNALNGNNLENGIPSDNNIDTELDIDLTKVTNWEIFLE